MSDPDDDPAEAYGCSTLLDHDGSRIWIAKGIRRNYERFDERKRERLGRVMELWCEEAQLSSVMFNPSEGRAADGTMLKAFKTFKHRLYGFEREIDGIRSFVIVDYDAAKKQNAANPIILKRAKARVTAFGKGK